MTQDLSLNDFKWVEETSVFNEDFIKNYNDESDEGYFPACSASWKLTNLSQWLIFFAWKNENWNIKKTCSKLELIC